MSRATRHSPTTGISTSKSNIRELIRLKTMSRKSANDGITSRNKQPLVLAGPRTQSERFRKLISFRGLAAHFVLWIRFMCRLGEKKKGLGILCHVAGVNPLGG